MRKIDLAMWSIGQSRISDLAFVYYLKTKRILYELMHSGANGAGRPKKWSFASALIFRIRKRIYKTKRVLYGLIVAPTGREGPKNEASRLHSYPSRIRKRIYNIYVLHSP